MVCWRRSPSIAAGVFHGLTSVCRCASEPGPSHFLLRVRRREPAAARPSAVFRPHRRLAGTGCPPARPPGPRRPPRPPHRHLQHHQPLQPALQGDAQAIRGDAPEELSAEAIRGIIAEAEETGISFFVIAGDESLTRLEIVDIALDFPHVVFLLVTNGLQLGPDLIRDLATLRNVVPVLSIEGTQAQTDERRGKGVHERLQAKMEQLKRAGIFFSLSLTVTRTNYDTVTDPAFLQPAVDAGCRLFLLLEYTPIREGTDE